LFVVWLCNTTLVFLETISQSADMTATSSLVGAQELSDKGPETHTVLETTAT